MANLTDVNTDDIGGVVLVPAGEYTLQVVKAEEATSSKGNEMIACEFEIIEGDYEGVIIKHWFTWASDWGAKFCKLFAEAGNVDVSNFCADTVKDATPVIAKIEVEDGQPYVDKEGEEKMGYDSNKINPFEFKSAM